MDIKKVLDDTQSSIVGQIHFAPGYSYVRKYIAEKINLDELVKIVLNFQECSRRLDEVSSDEYRRSGLEDDTWSEEIRLAYNENEAAMDAVLNWRP